MNVELLEQVKQRILAEPDAFRMDTWTCGTAHCIAGWALLLNDIPIENPEDGAAHQVTVSDEDPMIVAGELLEISPSQRERLFLASEWPTKFEAAHLNAASRRKRAENAARRIDHFIATNGEDETPEGEEEGGV